MITDARTALAGLLRHEAKSNTSKFALIRALNDLALGHPLLPHGNVVVPLRRIAERWLVSSWPFAGEPPLLQGPRTLKGGALTQDLSSRPPLTCLRLAWETFARRHPARCCSVGRGRLPAGVQQLTLEAVKAIVAAVRQPVRFGVTRPQPLSLPQFPLAGPSWSRDQPSSTLRERGDRVKGSITPWLVWFSILMACPANLRHPPRP